MLADISFWDMFASGGVFNSVSVVVCECSLLLTCLPLVVPLIL